MKLFMDHCEERESGCEKHCPEIIMGNHVPLCYKPLTTDSAEGAEVALDCGVKLPLLLADELLEDCWSATSKLESQVLRDGDLPEGYKEIIEKSFSALRKLEAIIREAT